MSAADPGVARQVGWLQAMPAAFVVIWSTGFVVARLAMPHAPALHFLWMRFLLSVACFAIWMQVARVPWPREWVQWWHLGVTGVLMHAVYLGGVWIAVKHGMGAGTVALIVGIQPVLTALWVGWRGEGERIGWRQWAGLAMGLAGLVLVLEHKLGDGEVTLLTLCSGLCALLGITVGTLYQKRYVKPLDVRAANAVQLVAAAVVVTALLPFEPGAVQWSPQVLLAMAWAVLALTLGASSLLYLLIARGAATHVASLLYLVPPTTVLMAWALFDERPGGWAWPGMAMVVLGVAWVVRPAGAARL